MTTMKMAPDNVPARETTYDNGMLIMKRHFDAPREQVFRMWTDAEHFANWFGPRDGKVPHCTVDARPGGVMHFCVEVPEGKGDFGGECVWGKWVFIDIVEPEKIVFNDYFADEEGNIVERPGFAVESVISVFFEVHEGGTMMTLRHELEIDHGEIAGWTAGFDRLDEYLRHG